MFETLLPATFGLVLGSLSFVVVGADHMHSLMLLYLAFFIGVVGFVYTYGKRRMPYSEVSDRAKAAQQRAEELSATQTLLQAQLRSQQKRVQHLSFENDGLRVQLEYTKRVGRKSMPVAPRPIGWNSEGMFVQFGTQIVHLKVLGATDTP
jgi:hypothetical protein